MRRLVSILMCAILLFMPMTVVFGHAEGGPGTAPSPNTPVGDDVIYDAVGNKQTLQVEGGDIIHLQEVADVIDTHEDERLRVRLDGIPGIKLSIQKQPRANTVSVVDVVQQRMEWLRGRGLIPEDIRVDSVADQSVYIRQALNNGMNMFRYLYLGATPEDIARTYRSSREKAT